MHNEKNLPRLGLDELSIEKSALRDLYFYIFNLKCSVHNSGGPVHRAQQKVSDAVRLFTHHIRLAFEEREVSAFYRHWLRTWKAGAVLHSPRILYKFENSFHF
jgi:hypothetical protein